MAIVTIMGFRGTISTIDNDAALVCFHFENPTPEQNEVVKQMQKELVSSGFKGVLLSVKSGVLISDLPEETMRSFGWIRDPNYTRP